MIETRALLMRFHAKLPQVSPKHTTNILVGGSIVFAMWITVAATIHSSARETPMVVLLCAIATVLLCGLISESSRRADRERELVSQQAKLETANLQLADSKQRAEQASKAKSLFLANMSHELKTPLNAIIGFSEVIKNGVTAPKDCVEFAEGILSSGNHLHALISNILDIAKIEAGKMSLDEELIDTSGLVKACIAALEHRDPTRSVAFDIDLPAEPVLIRGDAGKLRRVLTNLLSNAMKFTPDEGRVTVGLELSRQGDVVISISDTGIGMSADEVAVALEPFGQVDNGLAKLHAGAGIGLPLAKGLMELHGGGLMVESVKNVGTTIRTYLPAHRIVGRPAAAPAINAAA